jgi:hypothetical protein
MKSGSLDLLEHSRPHRACYGTALPLPLTQGDSGGEVNNLGGDNIGHCEGNVHIHMCLILNGYRDRAV